MNRISLTAIVFDAGTQVRAALDQDHVSSLADAMGEGAAIPPIVLFHDGNRYYIGDGFHRFMAAQRLKWREIDAEVQAGGKADALWFALGANKTNGKNMTPADKRHAILLADQIWPERSSREIAEQIGCGHAWVAEIRRSKQVSSGGHLERRVTGRDGKSYPASRQPLPRPSVTVEEPKLKMPDRSRAAVAQRRQDIRDMAERGFTTRQIASALGLKEEGCAGIIKAEGITVHADRVVGKTRHHDSNRIIERIVMDAENLTADVNLIDFSDLDSQRLQGWVDSLGASQKALGVFIRKLKEQQKHGEAA